ncbi:hypothetical protein B4O85_28960 [Pseudomonas azotoformans]|uniref:Phosphomannomutase n=2 Tax=Pseudomonas TaxID=286 RepID=A0A4Q0HCA5_PSEAZ|nr:hypothetical protein B4O85_28960 [Pseudomonas azotoformans]
MSNATFISGEFQSRLDAELTNTTTCRPARLRVVGHTAGSLSHGNLSQDSESGRSGLMTWLRACERGHRRDKAEPSLMVERMGLFPSSGEICRKVTDPRAVLERIKTLHAALALEIDEVEGLKLVLNDWRCKLRVSPTESVISLRVESRGDVALMQAKTSELLHQIGGRRAEHAGL